MNPELVFLDNDDLNFLEEIQPLPIVEKEITYIVKNNIFELEKTPCVYFNPFFSDDEQLLPEEPIGLPKVALTFEQNAIFQVNIGYHVDCVLPSGEKFSACMRRSKLSHLFRQNWESSYYVFLQTDLVTLARFLSYYFNLLGYSESDIADLNRKAIISRSDSSHAYLPDDITVPPTLQRAFSRMMELQINSNRYDGFHLTLSCGDPAESEDDFKFSIDLEDGLFKFNIYRQLRNEEVELRRQYRNFDCLECGYNSCGGYELMNIVTHDPAYGLRLLTDFFLYVNPKVSQDDIISGFLNLDYISVDDYDESLDDCSKYGYDCIGLYLKSAYHFYPDGSEDSPEVMNSFWEAIRVYEEQEEKEDAEFEVSKIEGVAAQNQSFRIGWNITYYTEGVEICRNDAVDDIVSSYIETIQADAIVDYLERFQPKRDFREKIEIYAGSLMCMLIDMDNDYFRTYGAQGDMIMNMHLSPEQVGIFEDAYLNEAGQMHRFRDGWYLISIKLGRDINSAAKRITYYLNALGYDLSTLKFEEVPMNFSPSYD